MTEVFVFYFKMLSCTCIYLFLWIIYLVIQTPQQSSPAVRVAFHGQRSSSAGDLSTPGKIPYHKALTNNGNGLNLSSGVFTAPLDGLYYFAWTGESSTETLVYLDSSSLPNDHLCSTYTSSAHQSLKCHAIVNLKKGDQVWAALANYKLSGIFDQNLRYTNFIGKLLGWIIMMPITEIYFYFITWVAI